MHECLQIIRVCTGVIIYACPNVDSIIHACGLHSTCSHPALHMQAARAAALKEVERIVASCTNCSNTGRAIVLVDDNAWLKSMRKTTAQIAKCCVSLPRLG
jgi:tRNA uridine 5-carbamoylmethylation protein Kti12